MKGEITSKFFLLTLQLCYSPDKLFYYLTFVLEVFVLCFEFAPDVLKAFNLLKAKTEYCVIFLKPL